MLSEISQTQKDRPCVIALIQSTPRIVRVTEAELSGGGPEWGEGNGQSVLNGGGVSVQMKKQPWGWTVGTLHNNVNVLNATDLSA